MRTFRKLIALAIAAWIALTYPTKPSIENLRQAFRRPVAIPYPDHNPYSKEKEQLGRELFFDTTLSRNHDMSCATCHNPNLAWSDGRSRGVGAHGQTLDRKVPTVLNVAWGWSFFWDGRAASLEEQALKPVQSEKEMNLTVPELVTRLNAVPHYVAAFEKAFSGVGITADTLSMALATFELGIVSAASPFDAWVEGNDHAISTSAARGFLLFNTKARCVNCHSGWNLTNGSYADTGLLSKDRGRGHLVPNTALDFTFKTPTLRNIAKRAPYMHDGQFATLTAVIDHYNAGGARAGKVKFVQPLGLTHSEKQDLLAFLDTLTGGTEPWRSRFASQ